MSEQNFGVLVNLAALKSDNFHELFRVSLSTLVNHTTLKRAYNPFRVSESS